MRDNHPPQDASCWERHGVRGTGECPRLREVGHCRHCEVLIAAGRARLDAPFTDAELREWTQAAAGDVESQAARRKLWLVMEAGEELLALPALSIAAVRLFSPPHRLPGRREGALLGALGWMGELAPCVCLAQALGAAPAPDAKHTVLARFADGLWALAVRRAPAVVESVEEAPGLLEWNGQPVRVLDETILLSKLREAMR